jgi:hypothetical protein
MLGDYVAVGYWSTIEINVGIICSCMPSIRLLLLRAFPKAMSVDHNKPKYTSDDSSASQKVGSKRHGMYSKNHGINYNRSPMDEFGSSTLELVKIDRIDADNQTVVCGHDQRR